jgi:hypothetical protein
MSKDFVEIKHSFNSGDLVVLLASLQHLFETTGKQSVIYQTVDFPAYYFQGAYSPIRDSNGQQVCMNREMFERMLPLLKSQPYIRDAFMWEGESVDFDIDQTRDSKAIPMPAGFLHQWNSSIFPELNHNPAKQWLYVEKDSISKDQYKDKIIINRTHRYTNPYINYYFLKPYQDRVLFSGTTEEYNHFCSQFDLQIEHLQTDNFYQLAQIISWCKFGIYNQSLTFHLADAMKTNRILELCAVFPNTFITGANGSQFYHQQALEYYFHKELNK